MTIGIQPIELKCSQLIPKLEDNILFQRTEVHYKSKVKQFLERDNRYWMVYDCLRVFIRLN